MTQEAKEIIDILDKYLKDNPSIRLGQALFNLDINQFANKEKPHKEFNHLRDIYNDSDKEILNRIKL